MKRKQLLVQRRRNWYDPFKSPPSFEKAKQHSKASQVGINFRRTNIRRCECCMQPVEKEQLDLRCSYSQLGFLGTSLAFYFEAIIIVFVLLVLLFIPPFISSFFINDGFRCCQLSAEWFASLSLENSSFDNAIVLSWMLTTAVILLARKYANRIIYNIQSQNPNQSSFAVKLSNLPISEEYEIKKWIVSAGGIQPLYVQIAYDLRQWQEAFKRRQELTILKNKRSQSNLEESLDYGDTNLLSFLNRSQQVDLSTIDAEIKRADQALCKYKNHITVSQEKQIGIAFAVFQSSKAAKEFISRRKAKKGIAFKQRAVMVEKAPNPKDIVWHNLFNHSIKKIQMMSILGVSIGLILLLFLCLYLRNASQNYRIFKHSSLPYIIVLTVYMIYQLGSHYLAQWEKKLSKCQTYTDQKLVAYRAYALLNIMLGLTLPYSFYVSEQNRIVLINFTLFLDAIIHPLLKAFNPSAITNNLIIELMRKRQSRMNLYTQDYLNRLLQGRAFKLGQNYHYLLRAIILSTFYSHSAPMSFLYYSISIIIEGLVQKYLLLRVCKTPSKFSTEVAYTFINTLGLVPLSLIAGTIVYKKVTGSLEGVHFWRLLLLLLLSFGFLWFYCIYLNRFQVQFEEQQHYFACRDRMTHLYKWENPIKKYNGDLYTIFPNTREPSALINESQIPDKMLLSQQKERATIEHARFKMITRMSLANQLYDIHVNDQYKRDADS